MKVGEQCVTRAKPLPLFGLRFFYLNDELRLAKDRFSVGCDLCTRTLVISIGEPDGQARCGLDQHPMTMANQFSHRRRCESDPILVVLDFLWNADLHAKHPQVCLQARRLATV